MKVFRFDIRRVPRRTPKMDLRVGAALDHPETFDPDRKLHRRVEGKPVDAGYEEFKQRRRREEITLSLFLLAAYGTVFVAIIVLLALTVTR